MATEDSAAAADFPAGTSRSEQAWCRPPTMQGLEARMIAGTLTLAAFVLTAAAALRSARLVRGGPPPLPTGRVATWPLRPIDLLGLGMFSALFGGLGLFSSMATTAPQQLGAAEFVGTILFQLMLASAVWVIVMLRVNPWHFFGLGWRGWPWALLLGPAAVLVMWILLGSLEIAGYARWMQELLGKPTVQEVVKTLRESNDPVVEVLLALAAVVAAPLCEEIVFRGYVYPVAKRFGGRFAATMFSALVFASAHGNLTALLPLGVFGVLLVLLYETTGSLWAPVSAHFFFNGTTVLLQLLAKWGILKFDLPT